MKLSRAIAIVFAASILTLSPLAAISQENTTTTPATGQVQTASDDSFDYGWLGLLGLIGLAGLSGRRRDRTTATR